MDRLLLIDKPKDWTSFDVVAKLRGILRKQTGQKIKIGHCGTLDPMATGLLLIVTGKFTKRVNELTKLQKTYEAEVTLGATSNTDDAEGELSNVSDQKPSEEEVRAALFSFLGEQMQVPPKFSAIKVNGVRSYAAARAGKEVKLEPRRVEILAIRDFEYCYPKVLFTVDVSSGTYIRSLARDLGEKLQKGAYLSGLRRTKVGEFDVGDAKKLEDFSLNQ